MFWNIVKCGLLTLLYVHVSNISAQARLLKGYASNRHGQIGILYNPSKHTVERVRVDSPAFYAGLMPGDKIIAVDGLTYRIGNYIEGDAGSEVELRVQRPGEGIFTVHIVRIPEEDINPHFVDFSVYNLQKQTQNCPLSWV